jgi:hypothetical protein
MSRLVHVLFLFLPLLSAAQYSYEDKTYLKEIKTIQFYNTSSEQSFPLIHLNSNDQLILSFDDLSDDTKNLYYTIEHCSADWQSSGLIQSQYLDGFFDNPLTDYRFSNLAKNRYTHYELNIPNQYCKPLLSGNYLLIVFMDNDHSKPLLTRRFMVADNQVSVDAFVDRSSVIDDRNKKQKINFTINHPELNIANPFEEIKIWVLQNNRWDNALLNKKPTFIRNGQLLYDDVNANVFDGLNEFRRFDIRSTRFLGERMSRIINDTTVYIQEDKSRQFDRYVTDLDYNGNFFIRRNEGSNPDVDADYINVNFFLDADMSSRYGDYYVIGKFNDWKISESNKMKYNDSYHGYRLETKLKQGIYNYYYVFVAKDAKTVDIASIEGNHYDTENDYTILVYQKKTGNRYDELIGVKYVAANPR